MNNYFSIRVPCLRGKSENNPRDAEAIAFDFIGQQVEVVTMRSPLPYRRAVYELAVCFRREFEYDFVQYGYEGKEDDPDARAFLWIEPIDDIAIGGCCFRWRDWSDAPPGWALQWIWLHPYRRGHGLLTKAWPIFKKHFGEFVVERPLSYGMQSFLRSVNAVSDKSVSK